MVHDQQLRSKDFALFSLLYNMGGGKPTCLHIDQALHVVEVFLLLPGPEDMARERRSEVAELRQQREGE